MLGMRRIRNGNLKREMSSRFIPIELLDKKIKYLIVGVPKCGTTSLGSYLTDRGYDVLEHELIFLSTQTAERHDYYDRTPIVVVRNPIERAYSEFIAFGRETVKKACDFSFYKAGLQMWDCLIYSLEYLRTIPGFPHKNITENKPIMTPQIKRQIIDELKIDYMDNG